MSQFYRTELRTMQIMYKDDNEKFLTIVANLLSNKDKKIDDLEFKLAITEDEVRILNAQASGEYD